MVFEYFAVFESVIILGRCAVYNFADKTGLNSGGWVLLDLVNGNGVGHVDDIVVWDVVVAKCHIGSRVLIC